MRCLVFASVPQSFTRHTQTLIAAVFDSLFYRNKEKSNIFLLKHRDDFWRVNKNAELRLSGFRSFALHLRSESNACIVRFLWKAMANKMFSFAYELNHRVGATKPFNIRPVICAGWCMCLCMRLKQHFCLYFLPLCHL